jgi:dihydrofolate synthase/folylpolyglutamate synthase
MLPRRPEPGSTLDAWLQYLEQLHSREIELGLERILLVFRKLFRGPWPARVVTVAGTNGKGTTVAALDRLLRSSGRRTATYTSPHLHHYNERICLDGTPVSDGQLIAAFETVENARGATPLTYFEFGTLAALVIFGQAQPDDVILEVGLGGRLDAVNILDPDLAIITTIGLDHVDWLGNDRETIGFEKAGIFRPGISAIFGEGPDENETPQSILQQAQAQGVNLRQQGGAFGWADPGRKLMYLEWQGERIECLLPETEIPENSAMNAVQALALLGIDPRGADLQGLATLTVPGRFERLSTSPDIIADVAHNPHAARWLAERLAVSKEDPASHTLAIYAGLADKDSLGVVQTLDHFVDTWFLAGLSVPRGLSGAALADRLSLYLEGRHQVCQTVEEALAAACAVARENDRILVFGSFYTVAQARRLI